MRGGDVPEGSFALARLQTVETARSIAGSSRGMVGDRRAWGAPALVLVMRQACLGFRDPLPSLWRPPLMGPVGAAAAAALAGAGPQEKLQAQIGRRIDVAVNADSFADLVSAWLMRHPREDAQRLPETTWSQVRDELAKLSPSWAMATLSLWAKAWATSSRICTEGPIGPCSFGCLLLAAPATA